LGLATATWRQCGVWRSTETLWRHGVAVDPTNPYAHNDLGSALVDQKRLDEAAAEFTEAARLDPSFADAHYNLAVTRGSQRRFAEAVTQSRAALPINPGDQQAARMLSWAQQQAEDAKPGG